MEQLPGYAPDLNPDEGIWQYLKRVEMDNLCCRDLDHLCQQLIRAKERLRHKRDIIRSCSQQCGYLVYPIVQVVGRAQNLSRPPNDDDSNGFEIIRPLIVSKIL